MKLTIVQIIGHFSTCKILWKKQCLQLGSKFRSPQKTVGPSDPTKFTLNTPKLMSVYCCRVWQVM